MTFFKLTHNKIKRRRAITDVISTMMLVMVTVAGSSTLIYFLNDGFVSGNLGTVESLDSATKSLKIIAYDTRDSYSLLNINNLNNNLDQKLCGISCNSEPNRIPANNGTEFLVIQLKNNSVDSIFLEQVFVNNSEHVWDSQTSGITLNASVDNFSGKYPSSGSFSLFDTNLPYVQYVDNQIPSGKTVHLLIKLNPTLEDIPLNKGIRLLFDVGDSSSKSYILYSGEAR